MDSSKDVLLAVKRRLDISSDYELARRMGVTRQSVSSLMNGRNYLSPDSCLWAAEVLDVSPLRIIAIAEAERAKRPDLAAKWRGIARVAMLSAALVSAGIFGAAGEARAALPGAGSKLHPLYIMRNGRPNKRRGKVEV